MWTIDGELVTDRFPEVVNATEFLPDGTALDGNLIARKSGLALPPIRVAEKIESQICQPKATHRLCPFSLSLSTFLKMAARISGGDL